MGICLSCVRGRNPPPPEQEPLLNEEQQTDYGSGEMSDEQWVRRQQELDQIVQKAQDSFIDISAVKNIESEPIKVGESTLSQSLEAKLSKIELSTVNSSKLPLTEQERSSLNIY